MDEPVVLVYYLTDSAKTPTRKTVGSIGYDLYACEETVVGAGKLARIPTGLVITYTGDYCLKIHARSSIELKWGLQIIPGVIDQDYEGEIYILARNLNDYDLTIPTNWAIAQILFERVVFPAIKEETTFDCDMDVDNTDSRKTGGFGSTDPPIDSGERCRTDLEYYQEGYAEDPFGEWGNGIKHVVGRENSLLCKE